MIKVVLMGFFALGFWVQAKHPELNFHCAGLNLITNMIWLFGDH